jgi:hypothetical protein
MPATTHIGQAPRPALPLPWGPAEPRGSSVTRLFRFERRWLVRLLESVLPRVPEALPLGAADVPMGRFVDELLARVPLQAVLGLRAGLWLVLLSPPFVVGRWRSFLGLGDGERVELLDRLRRSDRYLVRESALLFKLVGCLGFCGLAPVQRAAGIAPVDETPPSWVRP